MARDVEEMMLAKLLKRTPVKGIGLMILEFVIRADLPRCPAGIGSAGLNTGVKGYCDLVDHQRCVCGRGVVTCVGVGVW